MMIATMLPIVVVAFPLVCYFHVGFAHIFTC